MVKFAKRIQKKRRNTLKSHCFFFKPILKESFLGANLFWPSFSSVIGIVCQPLVRTGLDGASGTLNPLDVCVVISFTEVTEAHPPDDAFVSPTGVEPSDAGFVSTTVVHPPSVDLDPVASAANGADVGVVVVSDAVEFLMPACFSMASCIRFNSRSSRFISAFRFFSLSDFTKDDLRASSFMSFNRFFVAYESLFSSVCLAYLFVMVVVALQMLLVLTDFLVLFIA